MPRNEKEKNQPQKKPHEKKTKNRNQTFFFVNQVIWFGMKESMNKWFAKKEKKRIDRPREAVSRRAKSRDVGWYLQRKYFPRPRFHDRDIFASKWRIDRKVNFLIKNAACSSPKTAKSKHCAIDDRFVGFSIEVVSGPNRVCA